MAIVAVDPLAGRGAPDSLRQPYPAQDRSTLPHFPTEREAAAADVAGLTRETHITEAAKLRDAWLDENGKPREETDEIKRLVVGRFHCSPLRREMLLQELGSSLFN